MKFWVKFSSWIACLKKSLLAKKNCSTLKANGFGQNDRHFVNRTPLENQTKGYDKNQEHLQYSSPQCTLKNKLCCHLSRKVEEEVFFSWKLSDGRDQPLKVGFQKLHAIHKSSIGTQLQHVHHIFQLLKKYFKFRKSYFSHIPQLHIECRYVACSTKR